jgi:hypothetical protein
MLTALAWVDLAIFAEVQRTRARGRALGQDAPWGAFIGEAEVDEVLGDLLDIGPFRLDPQVGDGLDRLVAGKRAEVLRARTLDRARAGRGGSDDPLVELGLSFGLDDTDLDVLLMCLAPEVNSRYLRLFAYLQDDFAAQHLTPALALRFLAERRVDRIALLARFAPGSPLFRHRLLERGDEALPLPARPIRVAPRVARWLLHREAFDIDLAPWARIERPADAARPAVAAAVDAVIALCPEGQPPPLLRVVAQSRRDAIVAAEHLAAVRRAPLLVADLGAASRLGVTPPQIALALSREARMQRAVLLVLDPPGRDEHGVDPLGPLLVALADAPNPVLLHGADAPLDTPAGRVLPVALPPLTLEERLAAWREAAGDTPVDAAALARRYRYSRGQIAQVFELARSEAMSRGLPHPEARDVLAAARDAFVPDLGPLAERIEARRGWDDLVVPADAKSLLLELIAQVDRREQVLESLGAARVRAGEKGIKALFAGPPGTGKSLSAEVIAGELGYPLFRVDLASVVSKWVGETEKHLHRVFQSAEDAPCVLLFDEADALFGKRADVKGAQDRFANLEVSYLLQRLESYDGVAILTTNLKRNIDEAFLRRFTFVVDFPFPESAERLRIWQRVLPDRDALAADVRLDDVAGEFKLAGANIWNVAVAAACAAAAAPDRRITRAMLAHAVLREYQKLGREIAALRPALLQGGVDLATGESDEARPEGEAPQRRRAMSASEARRVREDRG